jgi:hypothetical protein
VARSSWSLPGIAGDVIIIMGKTGSTGGDGRNAGPAGTEAQYPR